MFKIYCDAAVASRLRKYRISLFDFPAFLVLTPPRRIRAYRMKIDEWGLRKYKSIKDRPTLRRPRIPLEHENSTSPSVQALTVAELDISVDEQLMFGDIGIPASPVDCSDLLRMIKGPSEYRHALEILLYKWQSGGQYMNAALDYLQDGRYCVRITEDPPVPNLFTLAEANVPREERSRLIKALLEADLFFDNQVFFAPHYILPSWVKRWRLAAKETDWEEAKRSLYHSDMAFTGSGETFVDCTLIVIAERLLKHNQNRLEELRGRATPLSTSDSLDAERCRRQYMDILKDFYATKLHLKYSFYKYSLQIVDWDEALAKEAQESQRKQYDLLFSKHIKYRQLISNYTDKPTDTIDDTLDVLLQKTSGKPRSISRGDF